jgi:hypothetical protein
MERLMEPSIPIDTPKLQRRPKTSDNKSLPANIGLRKAVNWREPEELCLKPGYAQFVEFAERDLIPLLPIEGNKRQKKRELLCDMLHQLMQTGIRGMLIRDTRDSSKPGVEFRVKLWDLLVAEGWCHKYRGSRADRIWTRYESTSKLHQYFPRCEELWRSAPLERNSRSPDHLIADAVVYGHSGKRDMQTGIRLPKSEWKTPLPFPMKGDPEYDYLCLLEDSVISINQHNEMHDWKVQLSPGVWISPEVSLRQIHIGNWNRGLRLYTSGVLSAQSLKKPIRRTMTIDCEETIELDFSSMVPRMAYHSVGIDAYGDIYRLHEVFPLLRSFAPDDKAFFSFVRSVLKKAMNTMFNVLGRKEAKRAVAFNCRRYLSHDRYRYFFSEVELLCFSELVDRIAKVHPEICHLFRYTTGIEMMTSEALIMLLSLMDITSTGRPALGIHDSIVCKISDAEFVESVMIKNYAWRFPGFKPEINSTKAPVTSCSRYACSDAV